MYFLISWRTSGGKSQNLRTNTCSSLTLPPICSNFEPQCYVGEAPLRRTEIHLENLLHRRNMQTIEAYATTARAICGSLCMSLSLKLNMVASTAPNLKLVRSNRRIFRRQLHAFSEENKSLEYRENITYNSNL